MFNKYFFIFVLVLSSALFAAWPIQQRAPSPSSSVYDEICQYKSFESAASRSENDGKEVILFISDDACKQLFRNAKNVREGLKAFENAVVACLAKDPRTGNTSPPSTICVGSANMTMGTVSNKDVECTKSANEALRMTSSTSGFISGIRGLSNGLLKKVVNTWTWMQGSVVNCFTKD